MKTLWGKHPARPRPVHGPEPPDGSPRPPLLLEREVREAGKQGSPASTAGGAWTLTAGDQYVSAGLDYKWTQDNSLPEALGRGPVPSPERGTGRPTILSLGWVRVSLSHVLHPQGSAAGALPLIPTWPWTMPPGTPRWEAAIR